MLLDYPLRILLMPNSTCYAGPEFTCKSNRRGGNVATAEITVDELRAALDAHQPLTVLDVRPADDRAEWTIPGSHHVDVYADLRRGDHASLASGVRELPRDRPIIAVCARGRTSMLAAKALETLGFDAFSLRGGMTAWTNAWNTADVPLAGRADLTVVQVRRTGKGCLSYLLLSNGEAAVVDPSLDPAVYIKLAASRHCRIVAVLDTHVHADHMTQAYHLADAARVPMYLPATDRVRHPHESLQNGDHVQIGGAAISALSTPGHTRESTCYVFENAAICTGDTLFLNGVGRPDLEAAGDESSARAHLLYRSLVDHVLSLAATLMVLPGHASVPLSFDGTPHAATLGSIRQSLSLASLDENAFVTAVLARIPPTPPNHHKIVRINEGREAWPGDLRQLEAGANRCAISA